MLRRSEICRSKRAVELPSGIHHHVSPTSRCPTSRSSPRTGRSTGNVKPSALPAHVNEDPPEVLAVLLDPDVLGRWRVLVKESKNVLLQLACPLAGDDLEERRLLRHGLVELLLQRLLDL